MKKNSILISFSALILLASCQKKDVTEFDSSKLKLTISKPFESQQFKKNDTVFISGNANYTNELHGYSIKITNKATKEIYLDIDEHLHDSSFDINTFWVDTLNVNTDLVLSITIEADHDGHEVSKEINFKSEL